MELHYRWMTCIVFVSTLSASDASDTSFNQGKHWAFRQLSAPVVPHPGGDDLLRSPIDSFLSTRLRAKNLTFSPDANRATFLRRAHFDLIGLPPSVKSSNAWSTMDRLDDQERLIDRLLASPHFGERWGQHWLDIAGFVPEAENSWKYRDYVLHAFNADKPFDRFLTEQLAGDEMVDWRTAETITPEMEELLIATGFLRCARDLTSCNMANILQVRHATVFDTIEIFGTGVMGLTLHCARCHDHKFDPIEQRDYYQIMALITPAFNPKAWVKGNERHLLNGKVRGLYDVGPPPTTYMLKSGSFENPGDSVVPGYIRSLSRSDETALFQQSEAVGDTSGHRLGLAHWLTALDTPASALVARVMANRLWQHLLGRGIVATPDNFGSGGSAPTHPDIIDYLAHDLVKGQWHRKRIVRNIMNSTVYRQASTRSHTVPGETTTDNRATSELHAHSIDPDNLLLWRMPLRRLESEILRDSMIWSGGRLNRKLNGDPIALKHLEGGILATDAEKLSSPAEAWRRSIYLKGVRVDGGTSPQPSMTLLSVFDQPILHTNCTQRKSSNVVLQSLTLLNDQFVLDQAIAFANHVKETAGTSPSQQVDMAFRIAVARPPSADEQSWSEAMLTDQITTLRDSAPGPTLPDQALISLCHALLSSNNFLYVE